MTKGSRVCVGTGMLLGAHLGPLARSHIEQAEVVFANVSDGIVELWVQGLNADVRSLQPYYRAGKSRRQTYAEMQAAVMAEVRAGKRVCLAIYGHPGVFARMPHQAIEQARDYPLDHPLIVYRAATLPIQKPRIEHCRLAELPTVAIDLEITVVLPPAGPMPADAEICARLAALDSEHRRVADVA